MIRKQQLPNEAMVFVLNGILRRRFAVSLSRADRPIWPFRKRISIADVASLVTNDPESVFSPQSLAAPSGALSLQKISLNIEVSEAPTSDGIPVSVTVAVEFRLRRSARRLARALEEGVLQGLAVNLPRRVRTIVGDVVGRCSLVGAVERQNELCRAVEARLREMARGELALEIDRVLLRVGVVNHSDTERQSTDKPSVDAVYELRRFLTVFAESGHALTKDDVKTLALAANDKDKLRILARSSAPLVIVPAEAAGLVGADIADLARAAPGASEPLTIEGTVKALPPRAA